MAIAAPTTADDDETDVDDGVDDTRPLSRHELKVQARPRDALPGSRRACGHGSHAHHSHQVRTRRGPKAVDKARTLPQGG